MFGLDMDRTEIIGMAVTKINDLKTQLSLATSYTEDQLDVMETDLTKYVFYITKINSLLSTEKTVNVSSVASEVIELIQGKRVSSKKRTDIVYPPEYVFPRNPSLTQFLTPQDIVDETYNEDGSGLKFEFGFTGTTNVIRTKYPPYLDRRFYNFKNKVWIKPQIVISIVGGDAKKVVDITPYFTSSIVNFSGDATGIYDRIVYYYDGEKLVTNFDFSDVEDRKKVKITYKKLLNTLRVKAVMKTNMPGISFYTPVIDQYTLLVDKQRVLN